MGTLNVNRSVSDAFYRYKMPRLLAKVEGKGNGIKTVVVNMADIAKSLCCPPTYPTKYFGCELGAQTQFDFKNDRFIVNGSHEANKLQDLLDGFIRKYILCPQCDNPETMLTVQIKKQTISQSCKACGHNGMLEVNHRLNTFIIKNPPTQNPAAQGSSLTEPKKKSKRKSAKDGADGNATADGDHSGSPELEDGNNTGGFDEVNGAGDEDDDDDWAVDVSEEAVRARMQDLTDGAKGLAISDDLEKTEKERVDLFYEFVRVRKATAALGHKELLAEAERLDVKHKAPLVLAELLFDQQIMAQIKTHRALFLRFTHEDKKAQRYLLGGIEQLVGLHKDQLLPKVPHILKELYDMDIVDEEELLEWAAKPSKKYVSKELNKEIHTRAEPFVKWLREAEEDEEDDSGDGGSDGDSDNDLEIEYDDRARQTTLREQTAAAQKPAAAAAAANNATAAKGEDEAEEVDIDAI